MVKLTSIGKMVPLAVGVTLATGSYAMGAGNNLESIATQCQAAAKVVNQNNQNLILFRKPKNGVKTGVWWCAVTDRGHLNGNPLLRYERRRLQTD